MAFAVHNLRSDRPRLNALTEAFLLANPDPGLRSRPRTEIDRAIEVGQGVIVVEGDEVRGCSLVYKYDLPEHPTLVSEVGTMRVTAAGHNLQSFLAKLHLVQIFLEEDADEVPTVFAVVEPGSASERTLIEKVHFTPWKPTPEVSAVRRTAGVPFSASKQALLAPPLAFDEAFDDLRRWHIGERRFQTPKGAETIELELGWFDPAVLNSRS